MSHLGVPNTSPPSSPSPNSVRIKSEPNSPPHLNHHTSSANSGTAPNTVSHSISHLSLPHAPHTTNHFSATGKTINNQYLLNENSCHFFYFIKLERFILGGQLPNNQSLVDSRHDFEGGPPPKRSRDTWPT